MAALVRKLYRMKSSSLLPQKKAVEHGLRPQQVSVMHGRIEDVRNNIMNQHIFSWSQIDAKDVQSILSTILNRRRLKISPRFLNCFQSCLGCCCMHSQAE